MTRKTEVPNLLDLHRRYYSRQASLPAIAQEVNVSTDVLRHRFREAGLPALPRGIPPGTWRKQVTGLDELIARYVAGEPAQKLAGEACISRHCFNLRLKEAGVPIRNSSDSMHIRWANALPAERAAMLEPAHATARGRKMLAHVLCAQAKGVQRTLANASPIEFMLADALRARDYAITQQLAIGPYNVDIAVHTPPVAVEVFGGYWHSYGRHYRRFFERSIHILNSGRHLLIVWLDGRRYPLDIYGIERIVAFLEEVSRDPAIPCQYRVILGNGKDAPVSKRHFNRPSDIERLYSGR